MFRMGNKGQFTIIALIMTFIMLVVYAAFLPAINEVINQILPNADTMTQMVIKFIPLTIALVILMSILLYSRPVYEY